MSSSSTARCTDFATDGDDSMHDRPRATCFLDISKSRFGR